MCKHAHTLPQVCSHSAPQRRRGLTSLFGLPKTEGGEHACGLHRVRIMLLMKSCVLKAACARRPTPRRALARQAARLDRPLIHSGSVRSPGQGQNLSRYLMHSCVCSSCDPPCVTHFVLTWEGLPQCGLVLRWHNKKKKKRG